MSDESKIDDSKFVLQSTRFGDLLVAKDSVIEFPSGIIGFPKLNQYIFKPVSCFGCITETLPNCFKGIISNVLA